MQITPAILTSDISEFKKQIERLNFVDSIDIDIIRPPFVENVTLPFEDIKSLIDYNKCSVGFHLMVEDPQLVGWLT